jgi:hypothetical protein
VDGDSLRVIHVVEGVDVWGNYFVRGYTALQLHTEGGSFIGRDTEVAPKGMVQDWGEGTDVNTISAAVTVLTVRAVAALVAEDMSVHMSVPW